MNKTSLAIGATIIAIMLVSGFLVASVYQQNQQLQTQLSQAHLFEGSIKVYSGNTLILSQKDVLAIPQAYNAVLCYLFNDTSGNCATLTLLYFGYGGSPTCGYYISGTT